MRYITLILAIIIFLAALSPKANASDHMERDGTYYTPISWQRDSWAHYERPKCYEDEPCWDCRTMGNRQCGPPYSRKWV